VSFFDRHLSFFNKKATTNAPSPLKFAQRLPTGIGQGATMFVAAFPIKDVSHCSTYQNY
jgi:hypothetical protein